MAQLCHLVPHRSLKRWLVHIVLGLHLATVFWFGSSSGSLRYSRHRWAAESLLYSSAQALRAGSLDGPRCGCSTSWMSCTSNSSCEQSISRCAGAFDSSSSASLANPYMKCLQALYLCLNLLSSEFIAPKTELLWLLTINLWSCLVWCWCWYCYTTFHQVPSRERSLAACSLHHPRLLLKFCFLAYRATQSAQSTDSEFSFDSHLE